MALTLTQELIYLIFEEEDLIIKTQTHLVRVDKVTLTRKVIYTTKITLYPSYTPSSNSGDHQEETMVAEGHLEVLAVEDHQESGR
jgi:hypothetical protein